MAVAIRPMRRADAPAVRALAASLPAWFNREGLSQIAKDLETQAGFVAEDDGRLVGFVTWNEAAPGTANLSWMGVEPRRHRQGAGRQLLDRLLLDLGAQGYSCVEVSTVADSVDYEPYDRTRRFYRAMGFADFRVDPDFYGEGDDRYDRLVMRRPVPPRL